MLESNNIVQTDDVVCSNNGVKYLSKSWSSKIKNFYVICIYDQEVKLDDRTISKPLNTSKENIPSMPVFRENNNSNTFIVWEQSYHENEDLFLKLRLAARNELILLIAKNIVTYLLKKYEDYTGASIKYHPKLKKNYFIDQLIQKFDTILKNDSFLVNNTVWEDFCNWFQVHLTDWVLEDMEGSIGSNKLKNLDEKELNELFYKYITNSLAEDSTFNLKFLNVINEYTEAWVKKVISSMNIKSISIKRTKQLLDLEEDLLLGDNSRNDMTFTLIDQGNFLVMSNAPYQSVREALSIKSFKSYDDKQWPTAKLSKGTIEGVVQLIPFKIDIKNIADYHKVVQESWDQAKELSELDVDVYDALCSFFLSKAKNHKGTVEIHLDDILSIRGLKPKLGGNGRRGGYENYQREQILKALSKIQNLWINLDKAIVYEKGKAVHRQLQGRAFIFKDHNNEDYIIGKHALEKKFMFTVDEVFGKYLNGSGRQVALLPIQALQYNPYQERWEKKLIRYLSWRWRTQARRGDYLQPHKISTLLDATGEKMNERAPSRTRDRLEQAFDRLLEDGVIASWQYEKWHESIASNKGWARVWGNSTVLIDPPKTIKEQYRPIEKKQKVQHKPSSNRDFSGQKNMGNIGEQIKDIRRKLGLTLLQVAEELEISSSYLSNIEREIKIPSNKIQNRIINWLQLY
ncbi:helix-turn-helix domain-containing protein [Virgibacillus necropolis]|uniref:HTH cro/C1-type domain-containing protein n=1 Tax=Virgibacillus necropolis TaxID=163877 RepID=A0A221MEW5_9BACI|nr:helix-turn-helix transcriptional regulator [Virgibacillus necropolis]ASN06162.1 hypothetical protein CFK40_14600 [Virgibacillus necropolis]